MYSIRPATLQDVATIAHQRRQMFTEMGALERAGIPERVILAWLSTQMEQGAYLGWLAQTGSTVVGGAGLLLYDWLPAPDLSTRRGYICNVYVEPEHRRQGLARRLVQGGLEACQERGISIVSLHASEAGRPVYEGLGFQPSPEMQWRAR